MQPLLTNANKSTGLWHIFGSLSLACCLPYLLAREPGMARVHPSDWALELWLLAIFFSPFAGALLALIASIRKRWWLLLAGAWVMAAILLLWDLHRHPLVI